MENSVITTSLGATAQDVAYAAGVIIARDERGYDPTERDILRSEKIIEALGGRVFQVNYYIPSSLNDRISNPAKIFHRHGYDLDGSNKLLTEKGLNDPEVVELFAFWTEFNKKQMESAEPVPPGENPLLYPDPPTVGFWVVEYTAQQLAAMREAERVQLARKIREAHTSLITRIDHAAQALEEAQKALESSPQVGELGVALPPEEQTQESPETEAARAKARARIDNNYNGCVREALRDAIERFESCLRGAELFDDTGKLDHLFAALRDVVKAQAISVNAMLAAKGRKLVEVPASISGEEGK